MFSTAKFKMSRLSIVRITVFDYRSLVAPINYFSRKFLAQGKIRSSVSDPLVVLLAVRY